MAEPILFEDARPYICEKINSINLAELGIQKDPQGYQLVNGFTEILVYTDHNATRPKEFVPSVAIVGNTSGIVYQFALYVLLPNLAPDATTA